VQPRYGEPLSAEATRELILSLVGRSTNRLQRKLKQFLAADHVRGLAQHINGCIAHRLTASERRKRIKDVDTFLGYLRSFLADMDPRIDELLAEMRDGAPKPSGAYDAVYYRKAADWHRREVFLRELRKSRLAWNERLAPLVNHLALFRHVLDHPVSSRKSEWAPMAFSIAEYLLHVLRDAACRCGERAPKGYGAENGLIIRFVREALIRISPRTTPPTCRAILVELDRTQKALKAIEKA
jgi:hypothetical protein